MEKSYILFVTANDIEFSALINSKMYKGIDIINSDDTNDENFYRLATFGNYDIIHLKLNSQGSILATASSFSISSAIKCYHPVAVILVGVAFGMDSNNNKDRKQQIGDVLISNQVQDYISGKYKDGKLEPRGVRVECGKNLISIFNNFANSWKHEIAGRYAKYEIGLILSGDYVVDDPVFKNELRNKFKDAIGGEMEGRGAYAACRNNDLTEFIIVKGICDWADGSKEKNKEFNQEIAAESAVSLLEHIFSYENIFNRLFSKNSYSNSFIREVKKKNI